MHGVLRTIAVALVLLGIFALAQDPIAAAQAASAANQELASLYQRLSGLPQGREPGTVKPPPVVVPRVRAPGTYSVGGVCTLIVTAMADTVQMSANLLPYTTLGQQPATISAYLAGVCRVTYVKAGVGVINLAAGDGTVKVCFASVPNVATTIFFYDDKTWTALQTTVEDGLTCAPAQKSGKYVLATKS
jgi:hypothetical protein